MPHKLLAFGVMGALLFIGTAQADEHDKKTILTVHEPLIVPGAQLQPGKYVMKLADSQSDRNIVEIFNDDESKLITTILAIPNRRTNLTSDTALMYWETPQGPALRSWFFPGDYAGQEFAYPKETADRIASANNNAQVPSYNATGQMSKDQLAGVQLNRGSQSNTAQANSSSPSDTFAERSDRSAPNAERTDPNARPEQRSAIDRTVPPVVTPEPGPAGPATRDSAQVNAQNNRNDTQDNTTLLAQNRPAPANPAPQPNRPVNNSATDNAKQGELPQTASPLGWLTAAGIVSFAGALLLRRLAMNS